jgi:response regulator RpfG family c-di-GMP phosphodiesterase
MPEEPLHGTDRSPKGRILLIHYYRAEREEIHRGLARKGFSVTTANSAKEGLRLAQVDRPDLILLHYRWPSGSYLSLSEALSRITSNGMPPYIALMRPLHQKGEEKIERSAGIRDFIFLPQLPDEICNKSATFLVLARERAAVPAWEEAPAPVPAWGFLIPRKEYEGGAAPPSA